MALLRCGQREPARERLQRCLELSPEDADVWFYLGRDDAEHGEPEARGRLCEARRLAELEGGASWLAEADALLEGLR